MKASLQLKLGQSLTMTPQLQQAIRLLQLSSVELQLEIQQALESNMMLELEEGDETEDENQAAPVDAKSSSIEVSTDRDVENIPDELPVDSQWDDIYDGGLSYSTVSGDGESTFYENQDIEEKSLHNHLLWQLNLTQTSDKDRAIAVAIIDALDDDGYLTCGLDEIAESVGGEIDSETDEIEAVLHLIQSLDPSGVGARDLGECLLLQLEQLDEDTIYLDKAKELVGKHLQIMGARDFNQLMRKLKVNQDDLQQIIALIQSLSPRPGSSIQNTKTEYIVPDVYVRKEKGVWKVELNTDVIPQLRINSTYARMIRRADNSADNTSLKSHLQEARWFIKSLQSRSETLLRVASTIVEKQRAFLEHGDEAMKPMVLHDIAELLGLHESTISRVTTRKYMHTPRGIYELKYFFSSQVSTDEGGSASSTAIRALIKKLINEEPHKKPLSDSKIADILSSQGIRVARRTVAKYREAMAIPPSNERKRLV
ncbi:MAG TPA: RNA polymerase factor sigma-54 [Gammaproteobacteria bacterium]